MEAASVLEATASETGGCSTPNVRIQLRTSSGVHHADELLDACAFRVHLVTVLSKYERVAKASAIIGGKLDGVAGRKGQSQFHREALISRMFQALHATDLPRREVEEVEDRGTVPDRRHDEFLAAKAAGQE